MIYPGNKIAEDVEDAMQPKNGLGPRLRRYFFTGIVVTAPIVITLWSAWWVLTFLDSVITKIIPAEYNPNTYLPFAVRDAAVAVVDSAGRRSGGLWYAMFAG